jgi:predicted PurR-regulated permease PerM
MSDAGSRDRPFARRVALTVVVVAVVVVALLLLRRVADVVITAFAGVLLSVLLDGLASGLSGRTRMRHGLALALVVTALLGLLTAAVAFAGPRIVTEIARLADRIPVGLGTLKAWVLQYEWGRNLLATPPEPGRLVPVGTDVLRGLGGAFSAMARWLVRVVIILVVGVHIAANPRAYAAGVVRLVPPARRERAGEILAAIGRALRWWLVGRAAAMGVIGVLITVGLMIAGVPLAFALGIIAALFAFIPILGPVLGAIPAILVGLSDSPARALYVIIVFVVVQLLETYVITPLIEQRAVSIPAALLITFQVVMGVLFGGLGILLATPVAVTLIVVIQMVYVQGVLRDEVRVLGDH